MIELEDKNNYYITKEIENNDITYIYLTNSKDFSNFCIRKKNKDDILIPLDDEQEFNKALNLFLENVN